MAKIALKKKTVSESTSLVSEIRHYARQIWLAGLGAYSRLGTEGSDYFKELVKAGEALEKKGKSLVTSQVDSANDSVKTGLFGEGKSRRPARQDRAGIRQPCR